MNMVLPEYVLDCLNRLEKEVQAYGKEQEMD